MDGSDAVSFVEGLRRSLLKETLEGLVVAGVRCGSKWLPNREAPVRPHGLRLVFQIQLEELIGAL